MWPEASAGAASHLGRLDGPARPIFPENQSMKAYRYTTTSDAGAMSLGEVMTPEPRPGQVRVRMTAASVNSRDLMMLAAAGRGEIKQRIPLSDGAGVVDAVGGSVKNLALPHFTWSHPSRVKC